MTNATNERLSPAAVASVYPAIDQACSTAGCIYPVWKTVADRHGAECCWKCWSSWASKNIADDSAASKRRVARAEAN